VWIPLVVVIWWLTLIIARWAARIERRLQTRYHDAVFGPPRPLLHYTCIAAGLEGPNVVQERRFLRCSWAMVRFILECFH
jgi:hypothetical protein